MRISENQFVTTLVSLVQLSSPAPCGACTFVIAHDLLTLPKNWFNEKGGERNIRVFSAELL